MKIFISWSGKFSKECAEILCSWIKCSLQATDPWISSRDIDKGSLWFTEISDQLKDTKVGIVCLTKDNKDKPWILFESGALAKGLSANRVCTFLINLKPTDLNNPLAQFNSTIPDKEGMKSLLITINKELGEKGLEDRILDEVFDTYWGRFEKQFVKLLESEPETGVNAPVRSDEDILEEILNTTRAIDRRIRSLEQRNKNISSNDDAVKEGLIARAQNNSVNSKTHIEDLIRQGLTGDQIFQNLTDNPRGPLSNDLLRNLEALISSRIDSYEKDSQ